MKTAECGTPSGYNAHRKRDEEACRECKDAQAAYQQTYRTKPGVTEKRTAYNAARGRAISRLLERHRGEFAALLAEERAKAEVST